MARSDVAVLSLLSACLLSFSFACGDREPAKTPASSEPAVSSMPEPAASAGPVSDVRKRKPFEVYSTCSDVVTVVFSEDPRASSAGKRTIAPSSSIEGPRNNDGNQIVWLLDTNGEPLVKVHVTRGMKRVEIGKSCRTLDAH